MRTNEGTSIEALMEQLIETGPQDMAAVIAGLFNLAMRIEQQDRWVSLVVRRAVDRKTSDRSGPVWADHNDPGHTTQLPILRKGLEDHMRKPQANSAIETIVTAA